MVKKMTLLIILSGAANFLHAANPGKNPMSRIPDLPTQHPAQQALQPKARIPGWPTIPELQTSPDNLEMVFKSIATPPIETIPSDILAEEAKTVQNEQVELNDKLQALLEQVAQVKKQMQKNARKIQPILVTELAKAENDEDLRTAFTKIGNYIANPLTKDQLRLQDIILPALATSNFEENPLRVYKILRFTDEIFKGTLMQEQVDAMAISLDKIKIAAGQSLYATPEITKIELTEEDTKQLAKMAEDTITQCRIPSNNKYNTLKHYLQFDYFNLFNEPNYQKTFAKPIAGTNYQTSLALESDARDLRVETEGALRKKKCQEKFKALFKENIKAFKNLGGRPISYASDIEDQNALVRYLMMRLMLQQKPARDSSPSQDTVFPNILWEIGFSWHIGSNGIRNIPTYQIFKLAPDTGTVIEEQLTQELIAEGAIPADETTTPAQGTATSSDDTIDTPME